MPVNRGTSNKAREENIHHEIDEGYPTKQAVAIGYSEQREAKKKKHDHAAHIKHVHKTVNSRISHG